ncbi:hypothetical protein [Halomarina litorea]|uniref:hypothetical protein n=1 Tax=Halomarina litorea TaxID=2961595 RepID=UPI0020C2ADE9|nr:hypothetical protein [Halomarina sp. BCD28]
MSIQQPTADSTAPTPRPTTRTAPADTDPGAHAAWVARCQSQFDARSTGRLHNLADEENWFAMPEDEAESRDHR